MTEKKALYESPGEKGKRGFEDLECYQLALEVMVKIHAFSKTLPYQFLMMKTEKTTTCIKNTPGTVIASEVKQSHMGFSAEIE